MAVQYRSIKVILDRLLRNSLMNELTFESAIDYTVDFFGINGIPEMYIEKLYKTEIRDYRASLPCDFIEEKQILFSTQFHQAAKFYPARYATDTFHDNLKCASNLDKSIDFSYSINNNFIFASIENGLLQMSYLAIATDDDGYPLLPDDTNFLLALEWYIKCQYYTKLWEEGNLEDKRLQHAEQEYAWAVGRLSAKMKMLSLGKAEAFFNTMNQLLPRTNEFSKRFRNAGTKEYLRRH